MWIPIELVEYTITSVHNRSPYQNPFGIAGPGGVGLGGDGAGGDGAGGASGGGRFNQARLKW
jgi:hypothetical protein